MPAIIRVGPDNFPSYINPLTGLVAVNPLLLNRRPIAAKIPNAPHSVRPQFGISLADHVWEYHLEWGLTRFVAIFYGNDAVVFGPIRSGRIFDAHLMNMYNAILVYNGADKRVIDYFGKVGQDFDLMVVEKECPPLCRSDNFPPPHNLFGNTAQVHEYILRNGVDDSRYDLGTNYFYTLSGYGTDLVSRLYIYYSYANYHYWEYDSNSERYYRYQGNKNWFEDSDRSYELLTDRLNGLPILADNIIAIYVPHEFYLKSSDTEIFEIDLVGRGKAQVFRNGKVADAIWVRGGENQPLRILNTNGSYFPLKPGVTFYQVFHTTSRVIQESDDIWTIIFERPEIP